MSKLERLVYEVVLDCYRESGFAPSAYRVWREVAHLEAGVTLEQVKATLSALVAKQLLKHRQARGNYLSEAWHP